MRTEGLQRSASMGMECCTTVDTGALVRQAWTRRGSAPATLTDDQLERTRRQAKAADRGDEILLDIARLFEIENAGPAATTLGLRRPSDGGVSAAIARAQAQQPDPTDEVLADIRHLFESEGVGLTPTAPAVSHPSNNGPDAAFELTESAVTPSSPSRSWGLWTAALVAVRGVQGGIGTLAGRAAQEALRVGVGSHGHPEQVSDGALAAGAVLNLGIGLMQGVRAGAHAMRASRRPNEYVRALRGLPTAAGAAGTPSVPAGLLCRAAISLAVGTAVFAASAHTGLIALAHLGGDAPSKPDAYKAVWQSNGNAAYAYTREIVNAALDGVGVVSHHAPLNARGALVSTGQYLVNALGQRAAQEYMQLSQGAEFDIRWPAISAVAEIIDVATVAGASRFGAPDEPIRFLRGRLSEREPEMPYRPPTPLEVIDRVSQRGASRHLVAEATQVVPREIGAALRPRFSDVAEIGARWGGTVLQSGTHLRELMWQAEAAVVSTRQVALEPSSNDFQRGAAARASFIRQDLDDIV